MTKYIDAEALINELEAGAMPIYWSGISGILGDKDCIRDYIERAPAADAQEVKHGKWIHVESSDTQTNKAYKCSCCKRLQYYIPCDRPMYCPHCGAKMDGKDGEQNDT